MMQSMTETPEPRNQPAGAPPQLQPSPPWAKPSRVYQAAAWVVIVAGVVFVTSMIFFTGAYVSGGGWYGHHHRGGCMMGESPSPMGRGPNSGPESVGPGPGGPAGTGTPPSPPAPPHP